MKKKNNRKIKALELVENKQDKKMFGEVVDFLDKHTFCMSPIQIQHFILNDIEYPTAYGKYEQAKFELAHRYNQLIDLYYDLSENKIKVAMKQREIDKEKDQLKKQLLALQKEKLELGLVGKKAQLKKILKEARVFYKVYKSQPQFCNLTEKQALKLEGENWSRKTMNMPTTFEERYGADYMKGAIGAGNYKKFLEVRRKAFGLLPREIFEVKELPGRNNSNLKTQSSKPKLKT